MAVSVIAQDNTAFASVTGSLTITKSNTVGNIQAGDLLICAITGLSNPATLTTSGWTTIRNDNQSGSDFTALQSRIADASDVSASGFTFTWSGTTGAAGGGFIVVRGWDTATTIYANNGATIANASDPSGSNTITPQADSLLVLIAAARQNAANPTTPTIATSNPTWTSQFSLNTTLGSDYTIDLWTAIRPQATATGNSSVTGGVGGTSDWALQIISVSPAKTNFPPYIKVRQAINRASTY